MNRLVDGGKQTWICAVAVFVVTSCSRLGLSHAAPGDIISCGSLGGNLTIAADGINDNGLAVGSSFTQTNEQHAYAFRAPGPPRDLGGTRAYGVNIHDQVVGQAGFGAGGTHAFSYRDGELIKDLGTLGGFNSIASDINDSGVIVGFSDTSTFSRAFKYSGNGPMVDLGSLPTGGYESYALGINRAGVIVGGARDLQGVDHLMRVVGDGPMEDLGRLDDYYQTYGRDVNNNGLIVGAARVYTNISDTVGIRCDWPNQITRLALLNGGSLSNAYAVNDSNVIVGSANDASGSSHAVLWTTSGGIVDLQAWMQLVNPIEGAKWTLRYAYDINNSGLICGLGQYNDGPGGLSDGQRGWILDASTFVPEPHVGPYLLAALRLLHARFRRKC